MGIKFPHPRKSTASGGAEAVDFRTPPLKELKKNNIFWRLFLWSSGTMTYRNSSKI